MAKKKPATTPAQVAETEPRDSAAAVEEPPEKKLERMSRWQSAMAGLVEEISKALTDERKAEEQLEAAKARCSEARQATKGLEAELTKMARDFARGQEWLPYESDQPPAGLFGDDPYERQSVAELGQPLIRRMDPEAFTAARKRDEPVGLTDAMIKALQERGYGLIGGLEAGLRGDPEGVSLKCNFTAHQDQILADTLALWRRHHPAPEREEV